MRLPSETKLQIMEINLGALKNPVLQAEVADLIVIDRETFNIHLAHLIEEERFEDCRVLTDNKDHLVYETLLEKQRNEVKKG